MQKYTIKMIAFTTVYGEVSWGVIFFFAGKEQELSWRYCQFRWGGGEGGGQGTGAKGAKNRENDRAVEEEGSEGEGEGEEEGSVSL